MLTVGSFSAVRLAGLFPGDPSLELQSDEFNWEYEGGLWGYDEVAGAKALFPREAPEAPAILELDASEFADGYVTVNGRLVCPPFDRGRAANADRVLAAIGLDLRMGAPQAAVEALATGPVTRGPFGEGPERVAVRFDHGAFLLRAIVSAPEGLLRLDITRPELLKANDLGV